MVLSLLLLIPPPRCHPCLRSSLCHCVLLISTHPSAMVLSSPLHIPLPWCCPHLRSSLCCPDRGSAWLRHLVASAAPAPAFPGTPVAHLQRDRHQPGVQQLTVALATSPWAAPGTGRPLPLCWPAEGDLFSPVRWRCPVTTAGRWRAVTPIPWAPAPWGPTPWMTPAWQPASRAAARPQPSPFAAGAGSRDGHRRLCTVLGPSCRSRHGPRSDTRLPVTSTRGLPRHWGTNPSPSRTQRDRDPGWLCQSSPSSSRSPAPSQEPSWRPSPRKKNCGEGCSFFPG